MADREGTRPPPSRDVAGEDFLFHLYRGSELLQDDRVHDAKAELEQALSLQPSDPKGQDLLGVVYFRLGLYPRAIVIYERLIQMYPQALEPRINLALSYLKTGQPTQARSELEKVLEQSPNHSRAWGYLGLAFQRMGDYERASHAFAAGGHETMARRLNEMAPSPSMRPPDQATPVKSDARRAAREAFHEIDREGFSRDPEMRRTPSGMWSAVEPGREPQMPPQLLPSLAPNRMSQPPVPVIEEPPSSELEGAPASIADHETVSRRGRDEWEAKDDREVLRAALLAERERPRERARISDTPKRATAFARDALLVFPRDKTVALHASGLVLVQAAAGFVARFDRVRSTSFAGGATTTTLSRKARGRTLEEPLGGAASPIVEIGGHGDLVLAPRPHHVLVPIAIDDEALYLREDAIAGFDLTTTYENGRLPVGDGEAIAMVQLRGPGVVIAELPSHEGETRAFTLEVTETTPAQVRASAVLGWLGRVVPRALLPSEAPAGARGLVSFTGVGMVILDGR